MLHDIVGFHHEIISASERGLPRRIYKISTQDNNDRIFYDTICRKSEAVYYNLALTAI
jgi:hypothetical protein